MLARRSLSAVPPPVVSARTPQALSKVCVLEPLEGKARKTATGKSVYSVSFETFWDLWPAHGRKHHKARALRAWRGEAKHGGEDRLLVLCRATLPAWMRCQQWMKDSGDKIPLPSTWLNGGNYANLPDGRRAVLDAEGFLAIPNVADASPDKARAAVVRSDLAALQEKLRRKA